MNRSTAVFVLAGLALVGFAVAAYLYTSAKSVDAPVAQAYMPSAFSRPDISAVTSAPLQAPTSAVDLATATIREQDRAADKPAAAKMGNALVRAHSPIMGPVDAKVTIVEFFDPACEACRAFYPIVKQTMAQYPKDVRLVLRYAPFHQGSDEAVRILETARLQNVFEPVLEALLARQPEWAAHSGMDTDKAWAIAGAAGLNLPKAKQSRLAPNITAVLNQDLADVRTVGVSQTPTFIVNGKPLRNFGAQELQDLVRAEVGAAQ